VSTRAKGEQCAIFYMTQVKSAVARLTKTATDMYRVENAENQENQRRKNNEKSKNNNLFWQGRRG